MNNEKMVKPYVDVCVIGAGAGGPAIAKHLVDANLGVVLLEAGRKFDPNTDYSDLPVDMIFGKFMWPFERKTYPFILEFDASGKVITYPVGFPDEGEPIPILIYIDMATGNPVPWSVDPFIPWFVFQHDPATGLLILQNGYPVEMPTTNPSGMPLPPSAAPFPMQQNKFATLFSGFGVGGTTLMYYGNNPRAYYTSLDEWDTVYAPLDGKRWRYELEPYYNWLEKFIPVTNAPMGYGPFDTNNAMVLVGAKHYSGLNLAPTDPDFSSSDIPMKIPMFDQNEHDPAYTDGGAEYGGFRGAPNNMTTNCWHCGNCMVGCHKPENSQLKDKVKRATNVSFIPDAEKNGLDLRPQSFVLAVLNPNPAEYNGVLLPNLVVYGEYPIYPEGPFKGQPIRVAVDENGQIIIGPGGQPVPGDHLLVDLHIQPAFIAVLSAGAAESPRIWLQTNELLDNPGFCDIIGTKINEYFEQDYGISNGFDYYANGLPQNPQVGSNFMGQYMNYIWGNYNKPVEQWVGQNGQTRVDIPPLGYIESGANTPALTAGGMNAAFDRIDPDYPEPYDYHVTSKFGVERKEEFHNNYKYSKLLLVFTEDDPLPNNRVFLDPNKKDLLYVQGAGPLQIPVPAIQYHPSDDTKARQRKLTKISMQMLKSVEEATPEDGVKLKPDPHNPGKLWIRHINPEASSVSSPKGTMSMDKVVDTNCEAYDAERLYVVDASVMPNTIASTSLTIMSLALRAAEAMTQKYRDHLFSDYEWKKWEGNIIGEW